MIIENSNYDDIRKLFIENNENYITEWSNEHGIKDQNMLKLVCNEDNISKGYAIICFDKNFCEIEEYPNRIENMPENITYIWEILVDKKYAGQGIGSSLLKYAIEKFPKHTFYSCIEKENIASIKLHEKFGFKEIYNFVGEPFNNKIPNEIMFELRR